MELLLGDLVEPHLGKPRPTVLYDYPASQAALAVVRRETPPVGERFELYIDGIELANGYCELLDPAELRRRNRTANAARQADGKPALPDESRLLAAMDHGLPACTGVALGFDRVVMLAAGAACIDEVIAFPIERGVSLMIQRTMEVNVPPLPAGPLPDPRFLDAPRVACPPSSTAWTKRT